MQDKMLTSTMSRGNIQQRTYVMARGGFSELGEKYQ
jgi:hypothetical protein